MKQNIPNSIIDEIRSRAGVFEVVSDFVLLKKSGKNYKGLCPFHSEKTPSFTVSPDKQIYHCFGCGAGGNVFKFLMEMEGISFVDAVRKLADRTYVKIPTQVQNSIHRIPKGEREHLLKINLAAKDYFLSLLKDPEGGRSAKDYLKSRDFDDETIADYQIGWSSPGWKDLLIRLEKKSKISRKELDKAGLVVKKDGGTDRDYYDRFRSRLIIPLKDIHGNIIGFAGRVLESGNPKYLNSPETLVYKKGNHLFGMDRARDSIRKQDQVLIVEGYFDQVRASQHGIRNAAATCGTALTSPQVGLLKNHTNNVVMIFDSDPAGQAAARRGFDILLEHDMKVKIAVLPEDHDPDSYILKFGPEKFLHRVESSPWYIEFYINKALGRDDINSPQGKTGAINKVLPLLAKIRNEVERSEWVRVLAEKAAVDDQSLLMELKKALAQKRPVISLPTAGSKTRPDPETYLVHLMFADKNVAAQIRHRLSVEEFRDPGLRHIVDVVYRRIDENLIPDIGEIVDQIESEEIQSRLTQIGLQTIMFDNLSRAAADCILEIKKRSVEEEVRKLKKQRNEAEEAGEAEKSRKIHSRLRELKLSLTAVKSCHE